MSCIWILEHEQETDPTIGFFFLWVEEQGALFSMIFFSYVPNSNIGCLLLYLANLLNLDHLIQGVF